MKKITGLCIIIIYLLLFLSGCCCCNPPISEVGGSDGLVNEREGYSHNAVKGKMTNNTEYDLYDVTIDFSFYDSDLNEVQDKQLHKSFLAKKDVWVYTVTCDDSNAALPLQFGCSYRGYLKPQK
jgi:hypothetical protein